MNLGKIIYAALASDSAVSAIAESRIYPDVIPAEIQRPSISYEIGSLPGVEGSAPIYSPVLTISAFARDKALAHSLADAIDAKIEGFSGSTTGVLLKNVWKTSYQEGFDPELEVFAVVLSYTAMIILTT